MLEDYGRQEKRKSDTNLDHAGDCREDGNAVGVGYMKCNEHEKSNGIDGKGLDEHCDDGLVCPTGCGRSPNGILNVPVVQNEPHNDHECEEDIESQGNRIV